MHGRQQQTAIPIRHATATQISTIKTSKERNAIQTLHNTTYKMITKWGKAE